jgi:hypothetical protein
MTGSYLLFVHFAAWLRDAACRWHWHVADTVVCGQARKCVGGRVLRLPLSGLLTATIVLSASLFYLDTPDGRCRRLGEGWLDFKAVSYCRVWQPLAGEPAYA